VIILLPNRLELDTMHAMRAHGLYINTVSGKRRMLNVACEVPVLTNVVPFRQSAVDQIFEWLLPERV
jgi:hypothetical protein